MLKANREYEYIEVPETAAASFADSLPARFYEEIPEFRGGHVRQHTDPDQLRARETSLRIIARFCDLAGNSKRHLKWVALRFENQRRHDLAAALGRWPMSHTT